VSAPEALPSEGPPGAPAPSRSDSVRRSVVLSGRRPGDAGDRLSRSRLSVSPPRRAALPGVASRWLRQPRPSGHSPGSWRLREDEEDQQPEPQPKSGSFCASKEPASSSSTRQTNASRAGSGSGRCGTSDSQVPGCPREASRRCRQEQHRPPDSLRSEGTPHERNGAKADQDDTSGNAHACDRTGVAVLPWRDYALHAGSRGRCPPPAQTFRSGVVVGCVHRDASCGLRCPATPVTYQSDITLIGDLSRAAVVGGRAGG